MTAVSSGRAFDAVIVGAGLAGSAAAILLARGGWSVALIERQPFPRQKVCGECVAASNLPLLDALGVGAAFHDRAGPALRRVSLSLGDQAVTADLPPAEQAGLAWGRALGRETLDTLLLDEARAAGATVFQPCGLQALQGVPGAWQCALREPGSSSVLRLRATVVIDAHGSWEDLPAERQARRLARSAADLFAFKANFTGTALPEGVITVLALDGAYGGMVVAGGGIATVACCIRRDRLGALRAQAPGLRAGEVVEAWLQHRDLGALQALRAATRDGPWLSSGPLRPGVHLEPEDGVFRIGNAAGEAHPILGEGMSMALQSAALLATLLLGSSGSAPAPAGPDQAALQRRYVATWRRAFTPRVRLAAVFAHLAMRPRSAQALLKLVKIWPGLLTRGAHWGGKVRYAEDTGRPRALHAVHPGHTPPTQELT